jgi:uncharacterized glyoxalase superfamily protein PhnB
VTGNGDDLDLRAKEILTIFPSVIDFETAIEFYLEIGFELDSRSDSMALLRKDDCKFLLQNSSSNWIADNFMMVLEVENLDDWWKMLEELRLQEKYPGVKLRSPEDYPWGKREIHLIDPCGVLWHISVPL